eukprot:5907257-Pleurochrysis_carterae.AAC.1
MAPQFCGDRSLNSRAFPCQIVRAMMDDEADGALRAKAEAASEARRVYGGCACFRITPKCDEIFS